VGQGAAEEGRLRRRPQPGLSCTHWQPEARRRLSAVGIRFAAIALTVPVRMASAEAFKSFLELAKPNIVEYPHQRRSTAPPSRSRNRPPRSRRGAIRRCCMPTYSRIVRNELPNHHTRHPVAQDRVTSQARHPQGPGWCPEELERIETADGHMPRLSTYSTENCETAQSRSRVVQSRHFG